MSQVMHHPGRQELPERDRAEARVLTSQLELRRGHLPRLERAEVLRAEPGELVEQRIQRACRVAGAMAEPIVWLESTVRPLGQDDACPWHPVGFFAIDEMADVVEGTERIGPLGAARPGRTDVLQERAHCSSGAFQNLDRQRDIEVHVSAVPLRGGTDAQCGESLARVIVPPQLERPCPRTRRRTRRTPYRR